MDTAVLIVSSVTSLLTITMMWLMGSQKRIAFLVSLANQIPWAILMVLTEAWGLAPLQVIMTILAVRGYRKWRPPASAAEHDEELL